VKRVRIPQPVAVQTSFRQRVPGGQHVPLHVGCALKQIGAQTPSSQVSLSGQHAPPHIGWPLAQAGRVHTLWMQASSSEQRVPHEPQLRGSVEVSTQVASQTVMPMVQTRWTRSALGSPHGTPPFAGSDLVSATDAEEVPVSAVQPTIAPRSTAMPHPDHLKHSRYSMFASQRCEVVSVR
jgi:hypothetical protein